MIATAIARTPAKGGHEPSEKEVENRLSLVSPSSAARPAPAIHLTARQLEVLALLCEGLPNKLICRRLDIAPGTAKAHISSILRELGVASRLQAVVAARRLGLLDAAQEDGRRSSYNGSGAGPAVEFYDRIAPGFFGERHT